MSKGYAEGPALEERQAALERGDGNGNANAKAVTSVAVYGSTEEQPEQHFIGWVGEVDPDELFTSGKAWGLSLVRRKERGS